MSPKWLGKCPSCEGWNCFAEELVTPADSGIRAEISFGGKPLPIEEIPVAEGRRLATGIAEIDRVLGGGVVGGSAVDYLDALDWAAKIGLDGLFKRSRANLKIVEDWVAKTDWIEFLADDPKVRSNTSVCLSVTHPKVASLDADAKSKFLKSIASELSKKNIAHDINSYKDAPAGYRFWCGPTIEESDLKTALAELEKVFNEKVKVL